MENITADSLRMAGQGRWPDYRELPWQLEMHNQFYPPPLYIICKTPTQEPQGGRGASEACATETVR